MPQISNKTPSILTSLPQDVCGEVVSYLNPKDQTQLFKLHSLARSNPSTYLPFEAFRAMCSFSENQETQSKLISRNFQVLDIDLKPQEIANRKNTSLKHCCFSKDGLKIFGIDHENNIHLFSSESGEELKKTSIQKKKSPLTPSHNWQGDSGLLDLTQIEEGYLVFSSNSKGSFIHTYSLILDLFDENLKIKASKKCRVDAQMITELDFWNKIRGKLHNFACFEQVTSWLEKLRSKDPSKFLPPHFGLPLVLEKIHTRQISPQDLDSGIFSKHSISFWTMKFNDFFNSTGQMAKIFHPKSPEVCPFSIDDTGKKVALKTAVDTCLYVYDLLKNEVTQTIPQEGEPSSFGFSPDGLTLYALNRLGEGKSSFTAWKEATGEKLYYIEGVDWDFRNSYGRPFTLDSSRVILAQSEHIGIWDAEKGILKHKIPKSSDESFTLSSDRSKLILYSKGGTLKIYALNHETLCLVEEKQKKILSHRKPLNPKKIISGQSLAEVSAVKVLQVENFLHFSFGNNYKPEIIERLKATNPRLILSFQYV